MRYLKTFESHSSDDVLIVVDVQKSFKKFFTDAYIEALKDYCGGFKKVYQIWDNHVDGKNVDKDYTTRILKSGTIATYMTFPTRQT
jgi:hypothetical protein